MSTITSLRDRSYAALLAGAREASSSAHYDHRGYSARWQDNLMVGLPLDEIAGDLGAGAGCELDGKLCAAHSSAALVVNSFGHWRTDPSTLSLGGLTGFRSLRFEATCPTGLGGTPPHLDFLAEGDEPVAVESKCTEWMLAKTSYFSPSYGRLLDSHGHSPWFKLIEYLRIHPNHYEFLDCAQLVKHAMGLIARYGARRVRLIYLFWEPGNSADFPECRRHHAEAKDLADRVNECSVQLVPKTYRDLWTGWERSGAPPSLPYLRTRYDRAV
ncbi:MAG: hypothetical protein IPP47_14420 [Bryobacterales bacterium]|nr:hypothetical protein [Bryobacterales bacterium]